MIASVIFTVSCVGGIFDDLEGHISSPGYPNAPPHAVSCQYIISVQQGFQIFLNFSDNFNIESMETEEGTSCHHHWLQVTNLHTRHATKRMLCT